MRYTAIRVASSRQCRASSGGHNGRDSLALRSSPKTAPIFFSNRSHLTTAPVFLSFRGALWVLSLCRSTYMDGTCVLSWLSPGCFLGDVTLLEVCCRETPSKGSTRNSAAGRPVRLQRTDSAE